jgi:hypothetical protein
VYGPCPPWITTFTDPPLAEQDELFVVKSTRLNAFGVCKVIDDVVVQKPASTTSTDIGSNSYIVRDIYVDRLRLRNYTSGAPSSPQAGDLYCINGVLGIYNGSNWVVVGTQT